MSYKDQFDMKRLPVRIISYKDKELAQCRELIIDYDGEKPSYHIYIVDKDDRTKLIDITNLIIKEGFPNAEVNADNFQVTIEGLVNAEKLRDILNDIWSKFIFPEDKNGFNYEEDISKVTGPNAKDILLTDSSGTIILPITSADNVYDKSGKTLQERLDSMTRIAFSTSYVRATVNKQSVFTIEYPFPNYHLGTNYFELRIGTVFIEKSRYEVTNNVASDGRVHTATIRFLDDTVEIGRAINVLYIYNSLAASDGDNKYMSGAQLAIGSIPSSRLERVSDRYDLNDSTSIATSKAVYLLYTLMLTSIGSSSGLIASCKDTINNGSVIGISGSYALSDGFIIYTSSTANTKAGLKVQVNGTQYPIYAGTELIKNTIPAGTPITLTYSASKNAFYVKSMYDYKIRTNRYSYIARDRETTISYHGLSYETGDQIFVYRNGVRLFESIDYSINNGAETITVFVRTEADERFVFESMNVVGR